MPDNFALLAMAFLPLSLSVVSFISYFKEQKSKKLPMKYRLRRKSLNH